MKRPQRYTGRVLDLQDSRHTEAFNPRTAGIDDASPLEVVRLLSEEDRTVTAAVASQEKAIAAVIGEVADRLGHGGRLFYVGAGTSGRLGVLDAAECPPTFNADPGQVVGDDRPAPSPGLLHRHYELKTTDGGFEVSYDSVVTFDRDGIPVRMEGEGEIQQNRENITGTNPVTFSNIYASDDA